MIGMILLLSAAHFCEQTQSGHNNRPRHGPLAPMSTPHIQTASPRPSACPGLLRIVPARDGGICRIRLPCGELTAAQAYAIAAAAETHGNGIIEITNRANVQLRGVRSDAAAALIAGLLHAGLGPSAQGGDDVRNLLVAPSFGIDPLALCDTAPLAQQILALLQDEPRFHQLSPKFALLLDGGENTMMLEHAHDLWLSAVQVDGALHFAFGFAGCPPCQGATQDAAGAVPAEHVLALVEAVLNVFLDCARPEQARMRELLAELPVDEFLRRVRQQVPCEFRALPAWRRQRAAPVAHIGAQPQRQPGLYWIGAAPALGRLRIDQLRALAQLADAFGDGCVRLTPYQSVLLPNIAIADRAMVVQQLARLSFSVSADQQLAHTIACSGSAGCAKGRADTKADALRLAELLGQRGAPVDVHLSGCERSCAAAHVAAFTLLAIEPGRYRLYRRDELQKGFGEIIASDVNIEQAGTLLIRARV